MAEKQTARPSHVPSFVTNLNRLVRRFAGRRLYALLRHRGRTSGKTYETPVMAWLTPGGMLVPLSWGTESDWYRNLIAANGCEVQVGGKWHRCAAPALIPPEGGLSYLPALTRAVARLFRVRQFVMLREVEQLS